MAVRDSIARKYTYEDWLLFPEDGKRYELIDGELFVTPAPSRKHQAAVLRLSYFLFDFLRRNPLGELYPAPFEVHFSNLDVVQPDLLFVANERLASLTEKNLEGAPDLAVEVLSKTTRKTDETRKLRLYEKFGVQEYWVVDPKDESARVFRREGDRLVLARALSAAAADAFETPLLPGLAIPLAEVFL
jgi:Uma2 family endonuclease